MSLGGVVVVVAGGVFENKLTWGETARGNNIKVGI